MQSLITYETKKKLNKKSERILKWNNNMPKLIGSNKSIPRRKFITINAWIKKKESSQINNLILYLKKLKKKN